MAATMHLASTLVLLAVVPTAHAVSQCNGESCTNSLQCERDSACYAHRGATSGVCLLVQQSSVRQFRYRHAGQKCGHAGDCDACSSCQNGMCVRGTESATKAHVEVGNVEVVQLRAKLANEESMMSQMLRDNQKDLKEVQRLRSREQHRSSVSNHVAYVEIGFAAITFFILVFILSLRFFRNRREAELRRSATPPTAPLSASQAVYLEEESSDDEEVTEEMEQELVEGSSATEPQNDLNPEDPNTCKVCMDAAINCVILDCGHMCACLDCARRCRNCPICRKPIRKRKRIYKS